MAMFQRYFINVFTKNFVNFNGRASRKEYWMFCLFSVLTTMVLSGIGWLLFGGRQLQAIYALGSFLPGLGLSIRRLHDIGKRGTWLCICFIPIIGAIWLIILMASEGAKGENEFGLAPEEVSA